MTSRSIGPDLGDILVHLTLQRTSEVGANEADQCRDEHAGREHRPVHPARRNFRRGARGEGQTTSNRDRSQNVPIAPCWQPPPLDASSENRNHSREVRSTPENIERDRWVRSRELPQLMDSRSPENQLCPDHVSAAIETA